MNISDCKHLPQKLKGPRSQTCEENHNCPFGTRVCLTCGYVGCCDSCDKHARIHSENTDHKIIASYPVNENSFIWCYEDDDYLKPNDKINLKILDNS